jgi:signal peptidase II
MPSAPDPNRPPAASAARPVGSSSRATHPSATTADNFKSPAAIARFVLTTILLLTADLIVKSLAFSRLATELIVLPDGRVQVRSRTFDLIPRVIHLEVTANQGAVFGIGQGQRWFFVAVSIAAIAFLTYLFRRGVRSWWYQIVLGMLLAGVLGNMVDRVRLGYVRDMIHALPGWHWPHWFVGMLPDWSWKYGEVFPWIFNVADSLLCVGVAVLILHGLFMAPPDAPTADKPSDASGHASTLPRPFPAK